MEGGKEGENCKATMVLEIYMEIIIRIPWIVEFRVHFGLEDRGR